MAGINHNHFSIRSTIRPCVRPLQEESENYASVGQISASSRIRNDMALFFCIHKCEKDIITIFAKRNATLVEISINFGRVLLLNESSYRSQIGPILKICLLSSKWDQSGICSFIRLGAALPQSWCYFLQLSVSFGEDSTKNHSTIYPALLIEMLLCICMFN